MLRILKQLDALLRGEATRLSSLERGQIEIPLESLTIAVVVLGVFSGLCTGTFAVFRSAWSTGVVSWDAYMQLLASGLKLPLLFILTFLVTFPSLYVFNALVGSRLSVVSVWRLVWAMLAIMLSVLASLGPIVVFFGASTESYPFMKLLNVAAAGIAGGFGLAFLMRTLHRLVMVHDRLDRQEAIRLTAAAATDVNEALTPHSDGSTETRDDTGTAASPRPGPLDRIGPTSAKARLVFRIWVVVFCMVGAQMSWVLRPFVGSPNLPFSWFRRRENNVFLDILQSISNLFSA